MREHFSIAVLMLLLAFVGVEPGKAEVTKICRAGILSSFLSPC